MHFLISCCIAGLLAASVTDSTSTEVQTIFSQIQDFKKKFPKGHQESVQELYQSNEKIRLVSYNILHSHFDRQHPLEHRWDLRKKGVKELIEHMDGDIYLFQECSRKQKNWIWEHFSKDYLIVAGTNAYFENLPVLLRKSRFELLDTFNLCADGSERVRYVSIKDKKTLKELHLMNVHTEFQDIEKRQSTFDRIVLTYKRLNSPKNFVVGGDMNAFDPYVTHKNLPFWDGNLCHQKLVQSGLFDLKEGVLFGLFGPFGTYTNSSPNDTTPFLGEGVFGIYLDRFYGAENIQPLFFGVEKGKVDGEFPSDHMPIFTEFLLKG